MSREAVVRAIAAPVLARLAGRSRAVLTGGERAAYLELDGFVAVLADARAPWLPNAIALAGRPPAYGGEVRIAQGRLSAPGWSARWNPQRPPVWWPVLAAPRGSAGAVSARGEAILRALGAPSAGPEALAAALDGGATAPEVGPLTAALAGRDAGLARRAGLELAGRGPGLTPAGDDLLAGVAVTVVAAGDAAGFAAPARTAWLSALVPGDLRSRTTALSATLLELAVAGAGPRPLHALLDLEREDWREPLALLQALGASTGRALALGVGAAAVLLGRASSQRVPPLEAPNLRA